MNRKITPLCGPEPETLLFWLFESDLFYLKWLSLLMSKCNMEIITLVQDGALNVYLQHLFQSILHV
jgi:hypothetical protein